MVYKNLHIQLVFFVMVHPGRLTWNLQITHLERNMIFQTSMNMCKMLIFQGGNVGNRRYFWWFDQPPQKKTDVPHEKGPFQKENCLEKTSFSGAMLVFGRVHTID